MPHHRFAAAFGILFAVTLTHAGSIITTNLPAGTTIVNVSGTNEGAATYDAEQTYWYQPIALDGNFLELTLDPGTYAFDITDVKDAQARFPLLTNAQLGTIGDGGWTYNTPWATDYLVFDSSAINDPFQPQLFTGAVVPLTSYPGFGNGPLAYAAAKSGGYADEIVVGTGGRHHGTTTHTYTLATRQTLLFAVPDWYLPDNAGTVSVVVRAVPEPASFAALAVGGLALIRRRRQPRTTRS